MGARRWSWWPWLVGAAVAAVAVASAARLTVSDGAIAAGKGAPAVCDADGVTVAQVVSGTSVASVDVAGIAADCAGGTVKVTVRNGTDTAQEGTATIPAGGGSVNVSLASPVPLKDSHLIGVFLQGP
ncbi:MAG: hypothetical protein ACRD0O_12870 [Acidimicrobiia bacterium]